MNSRRTIISAALATVLTVLAACGKTEIPQPKPTPTPDPQEDTSTVVEPAACTNRIVAHRGGAAECGYPDNSRASLQYAMKLKLYGSECDIYWTKDNNVIIGHASSDYKLNGLTPWTSTVDEIRKAGKLKNGEEMPTLDDFLDIVLTKDNCTRLILDIKNLGSSLTDYPCKAVQRACEIIKEKGAEKFCEFICTSNTTVARTAAACMQTYNIPVGWMSQSAPATHKSYGFSWANLPAASMCTAAGGSGSFTVDQFASAGMQISVFNLDSKSGDSNAVYSAQALSYYKSNYSKMKFICTNYPNWLLNQLK